MNAPPAVTAVEPPSQDEVEQAAASPALAVAALVYVGTSALVKLREPLVLARLVIRRSSSSVAG